MSEIDQMHKRFSKSKLSNTEVKVCKSIGCRYLSEGRWASNCNGGGMSSRIMAMFIPRGCARGYDQSETTDPDIIDID